MRNLMLTLNALAILFTATPVVAQTTEYQSDFEGTWVIYRDKPNHICFAVVRKDRYVISFNRDTQVTTMTFQAPAWSTESRKTIPVRLSWYAGKKMLGSADVIAIVSGSTGSKALQFQAEGDRVLTSWRKSTTLTFQYDNKIQHQVQFVKNIDPMLSMTYDCTYGE